MRIVPYVFLSAALLSGLGNAQVTIRNPGAAKTQAFVTFGMVFKPGDIPAGKAATLTGATAYQVDAKATHADGSLRHAVVSVAFASMASGEMKTLTFAPGTAPTGTAPSSADVLKTTFDAVVSVTVGGATYTASARDGLAAAKTWLEGPVCTEWLVTAPLKTSDGSVHPHLHVRYGIRAYQGLKSIRADVSVENDWAYEPSPQGYTYDVKITVGGVQTYAKTGLAHTHHARWRKVFWWGDDAGLEWRYDTDYLLATGSLPNYDKLVKVSETAIAALKSNFEPMSNGGLSSDMPATGAQVDIGPLPDYAAIWVLTQDPRALSSVIANGNCGGSYQIHYRNKASDRPVTLDEYPYMTILGNVSDTHNPATDKNEAFPDVTNGLAVHDPDDAHQPSIAYLPYLITGDYFFLEELQFWANWNMILGNPGYRKDKTGLVKWAQNRGQAWSMRTLGQAGYITPDNHPQKKYFIEKVNNNLAYYNQQFTNNPAANSMGYMEGQYPYSPFGIAPWQDDFFTWSIGFLAQLGYEDAKPLAAWKGKFVTGRLTAPGYCWLQASIYSMQVGPADKTFYTSFAEIYNANFPGATCTGTRMDGYPEEATGYGANMQPALAAAVDANVPNAQAAWEKYQTRNPKQDYSSQPEFAVVPRSVNGAGIVPRGARAGNSGPNGMAWFVPGSRLKFNLGFAGDLRLELYDTNGRQILDWGLGHMPAGSHVIDPVRDLARRQWGLGPYLVRVRASAANRQPENLVLSPAR